IADLTMAQKQEMPPLAYRSWSWSQSWLVLIEPLALKERPSALLIAVHFEHWHWPQRQAPRLLKPRIAPAAREQSLEQKRVRQRWAYPPLQRTQRRRLRERLASAVLTQAPVAEPHQALCCLLGTAGSHSAVPLLYRHR